MSSKIKHVISHSKKDLPRDSPQLTSQPLTLPPLLSFFSSSSSPRFLSASSASTLVFFSGIRLNASHLHFWASSFPCQQTMLFLYERHPKGCIISSATVTFSPRMLSSTLDAVSHWSAKHYVQTKSFFFQKLSFQLHFSCYIRFFYSEG